jgi:mono/diheme cytochrome c family protein
MKWLGLLFAFPLLALVPPANADGYCRSSYRASYSYYTPAKTYSYTPTYTPTYTYTNTYEYPVYLKAVKAFVSPDYYSSTVDYYRDKLLVDAVAGKTAEVLKSQLEMNTLKQEVESLRRQLQQPVPSNGNGGYQPPLQQAPPQQQYQPQLEAPKQTMPKAVGQGHPVPEGLQQIVQTSCIRCHGATAQTAGGGLDFRDLATVPVAVRLAAKAAIDDGFMPKGGKPLDDAAAALFHQWATGRKGAALSSQK